MRARRKPRRRPKAAPTWTENPRGPGEPGPYKFERR
jgi:hypothetical protein